MKIIRNKYLIVVIIVFALYIKQSSAQQEPLFTQYMFNTLIVNPAYAGTRDALNINTLTRYQWVGVEGAPKTYSLGLHTPLYQKNVGVGFTFINDNTGPISTNYLGLNYAYRIKINKKLTLSMGLKGGIHWYNSNLTSLETTDPTDPEFQLNEKQTNPNFGIGLYLFSDSYYVGFSSPKLFELTIDSETSSSLNELKRHYYLIGGYVYNVNPKLDFKPSVFTRIVSGAPISTDLTLQFYYDKMIWFGAMYRIGDAIGAFFDIRLNKQLTIGYGYDYSLNALIGLNSGSHEIMLSYDFNKIKAGKVISPRYF